MYYLLPASSSTAGRTSPTHEAADQFRNGTAIEIHMRKEGSARVPKDVPSQFVRQTCFLKRKSNAERNGAELECSTKPVSYTQKIVYTQTIKQ